jgi:hypothetical protein
MILTTHALAGAVIGKNIENPWLIIILSIIVHFVMDTFRHGEYVEIFNKNTSIKNSGYKVAFDFIIGLFIVSFIAWGKSFEFEIIRNMSLGIFFSVLPDFITAIYWKSRWKFLEKYYAFHSLVHKYPRHAPERQWTFRNARNDIVISLLAIIILLFS